jgi:putative tryptophan/tyrosine transport system substrate-binding protein
MAGKKLTVLNLTRLLMTRYNDSEKKYFTKKNWLKIRIIISMMIIFVYMNFQPAQVLAEGKIMIINSNKIVKKYKLAEKEFSTKFTDSVVVDLAVPGVKENDIRQQINKLNIDLIYCIGSKAFKVARRITKRKKIIFSSAINWRRFSLGRNVYGISNEPLTDVQITLFKYFFPYISNVGVIYSKKINSEWYKNAKISAANTGLKISGRPLRNPKNLSRELDRLLPDVDLLWLKADPLVLSSKKAVSLIFSKCEEYKKPIFSYSQVFANYGATMVISVDSPTVGRQAAGLAIMLQEEKVPAHRVQPPAGTHISLNLQKIEEYGLVFNEEALDSVNSLIH